MQIFAAKVRKPCCLQESAMQKLRPWGVHSRNTNHSSREGCCNWDFSEVRAHPLNTDVGTSCPWCSWLLVSRAAVASGTSAEVWEPRSRTGCWHLCIKHWCSFLEFNEAPIHKNWAMEPFDFGRDSQQCEAQHLLDCCSGEGSHLPAEWWKQLYSRKGAGVVKLSDKNCQWKKNVKDTYSKHWRYRFIWECLKSSAVIYNPRE